MSISSQCLSSVAQGREEMVQDASASLKEGTYCSIVPTPHKKLYGSYTIYRVVFFGASSFGRFGRRGKTPNLNQGVFTDTPCVTLSH